MVIFGDEFLGRERRAELLREAGERRMARRLREARRSAAGAERRAESGDGREAGVTVRWGLHADDEKVAGLLELNGMPRWVAFEERFVVAEQDGAVLAALSYRTEPKRMLLGLLVADPWAGERRLAIALYRGALDLAHEMGVREIRADAPDHGVYLREAGYRRTLGGWRLDAVRPDGGRSRTFFAPRRAA